MRIALTRIESVCQHLAWKRVVEFQIKPRQVPRVACLNARKFGARPTWPIERKTVAVFASQEFDFNFGLFAGRYLLKVEPTYAGPDVERRAQYARNLSGLQLLWPAFNAFRAKEKRGN